MHIALDKLTNDDLVRILNRTEEMLGETISKVLSLDDTKLEFEPEALKAIAAKAIERNTGARDFVQSLKKL